MKFYIDTANVDEIRKANDMGIIAGVTTNPSLIAKEGRDYAETLKEITSIVDGPISGEVKATTLDAAGMIKEGRAIYALNPAHMVVKIPMTAEGLKAIKVLSSEGIPTNCTLIFSANQALLAARAGAAYVSPLSGASGRYRPARHRPDPDHCRDVRQLPRHPYRDHRCFGAQPHPYHGLRSGRCRYCYRAFQGAGADDPPPLTDAGIEKFQKDYVAVFGK